MRYSINVKDLEIGMFVILPTSWFEHPFLTGKFIIKSQDQIDKIIQCGFTEVFIDTQKGTGHATSGPKNRANEIIIPPQKWEPETLIPLELSEAIRDTSLSSEKKSQIVYISSLQIMERLLEDPSVENIKASKQGIAEIVDVIMWDDAICNHLLKITSHDYNTYTHSVNVGVLSILLAKALLKGSDDHDLHELGAGFFLHDIGKVRIDLSILNKPGQLTEDELHIIQAHPRHGYNLLSETNQLSNECNIIVMQHHEKDNGKGYPYGLKGDEIHLYAQICRLADVYDSLTSERSYRRRLSTFDALKLMKEELSDNFHKLLFEKFVVLFS